MQKFSAMRNKSDTQFMQAAIAQAKAGQTSFGCVITEDNEIVVSAFNTVKNDQDPTAHAEINAIRKLAKIPDYKNRNLTLYTTGEPCPMCMTAIMYAGIDRVVFGVPITDIRSFYKQVMISSNEIVKNGFKQIEIKAGILYEECLHLFKTTNHDQR